MRAAHWCSSDPHSRKPESRRPQTSQVDRNNEPERRSEATPPSDIKGASPLYRGRTPYQRSRSSQRGPSRGLPIRSDLNGNSGSPTAEEAPEEARVPLHLRNLFRTVLAIAPLRSGNHRTHRVNVLAAASPRRLTAHLALHRTAHVVLLGFSHPRASLFNPVKPEP